MHDPSDAPEVGERGLMRPSQTPLGALGCTWAPKPWVAPVEDVAKGAPPGAVDVRAVWAGHSMLVFQSLEAGGRLMLSDHHTSTILADTAT